jgi:hypothetical protein
VPFEGNLVKVGKSEILLCWYRNLRQLSLLVDEFINPISFKIIMNNKELKLADIGNHT